MTTCTPFEDDLKAYVDGELSLSDRYRVQWHLIGCGECRKECNEMRKLGHELTASLEPMTNSLRDRILGAAPTAIGTEAALPRLRVAHCRSVHVRPLAALRC